VGNRESPRLRAVEPRDAVGVADYSSHSQRVHKDLGDTVGIGCPLRLGPPALTTFIDVLDLRRVDEADVSDPSFVIELQMFDGHGIRICVELGQRREF